MDRGGIPLPLGAQGLHAVTVHFFVRGRKQKGVYMEIQTCIKCHQKKELNAENFYRKNSCKRGFESQCKECRRISDKKKYQKKKDKILLQKKQYYERKKDKIKERQKEYYQSNVEKKR